MIPFNLKIDTTGVKHVIEQIENHIIAEVMEKLISDIRNVVEGLTPVGRHEEQLRAAGGKTNDIVRMKESWTGVYSGIGGDFLAFCNTRYYAEFIEFGWNRKPGPRTKVHTDGKTYSTFAMGGVLRPLLEHGIEGQSIEEHAKNIMDELINELAG